MAKPELGNKRQCQNCGAKFFDLNRDPIICPKCGTVFQATPTRAQRAAVKADEEDEIAAPTGAELVSLEEADATDEKAVVVAEDEIEVEEDDAPEDTFLEEEEADDDDVSGLIDGDIATDEEP